MSGTAEDARVAAGDHVAALATSPWASLASLPPWDLLQHLGDRLRALIAAISSEAYHCRDDVAVHRSAIVEAGAVLKGPLIIGPRCLVAHGATLRGGNWLAADCIVGPGAELKSSLLFDGSRLAHFNFVGDSVVGADVNFEAGSIVCNHRNERAERQVYAVIAGARVATGVSKFGALIGDHCRLGANAVVAPGAILVPGTVVGRMELIDQDARR